MQQLATVLLLSLRRPLRASRAKNNICDVPLQLHTLPVRLLGWTSFIHSAGDWMQGKQPFSWDFSLRHSILPPGKLITVLFLSRTWFDWTFSFLLAASPHFWHLCCAPSSCYCQCLLTSSRISNKTREAEVHLRTLRRRNELILVIIHSDHLEVKQVEVGSWTCSCEPVYISPLMHLSTSSRSQKRVQSAKLKLLCPNSVTADAVGIFPQLELTAK